MPSILAAAQRTIKVRVWVQFALATLTLATTSIGTLAAPPPYEKSARYHVFVDGRRSGTQDVEFVPQPNGFTVNTALSVRVNIAFVTVYRYQQDGQEDWSHGKAMGFEYTTNDDGKISHVAAQRDGDTFAVTAANGDKTAIPATAAMPPAMWNPDIVRHDHLVDPETGKLVALSVTPLTKTSAKIAKTQIHGRGFAIDSFIKGELWFNQHNQLIALSFTKDGHKIELVKI
jgi:hypothetical protein